MSGLLGKVVAITRNPEKSIEFSDKLRLRGAAILYYPCIQIDSPRDLNVLDEAILGLFSGRFDWLILTSQNAVESIRLRIQSIGISGEVPKSVRIAAVGSRTARAAESVFGRMPHVVPKIYSAQGLLNEIYPKAGESFFIPTSQIGRTELKDALIAKGAKVSIVQAYLTQRGSGGDNLIGFLRDRKVSAITFLSPSAVNYFLERFSSEGGEEKDLNGVCIACIGPTTQQAAKDAGLTAHVVSKKQTIDDLVDDLNRYFC